MLPLMILPNHFETAPFLGVMVIMDTIYGDNLTNAPLLRNLHPKVPECTLAQILHPVPIKYTPRSDNDPWGTS